MIFMKRVPPAMLSMEGDSFLFCRLLEKYRASPNFFHKFCFEIFLSQGLEIVFVECIDKTGKPKRSVDNYYLTKEVNLFISLK